MKRDRRYQGPRRPGAVRATGVSVLLVGAMGCGSGFVGDSYVPQTPHERYEANLRAAGLAGTALGSDWLTAAERSLAEALQIDAPYQEIGFFDPADARAVGYRVTLRRGQEVRASMRVEDDRPVQVFLDLFVLSPGAGTPRLLAFADTGKHELVYAARRTGEYILRIQPELLRGGRYTVDVAVTGSLAFPVGGHDMEAILSVFGDPRDGGRRRHHGVDIFAPRGTPVLAATTGVIRRVGITARGGRIIWQRDTLGQSLYYAHLHRQNVEPGTYVMRGDTIGFVGNSGNARTTPPHLHFGVYQRGPYDPFPYLEPLPTAAPTFIGETALVGGWARAARQSTRIRESASLRARVRTEVPRHTPMRVLGGSGRWYRVFLPDGTTGYVAVRVTEPIDRALRSRLLASGALLRSGPAMDAAAVDSVPPGGEVPVLGVYGDFAFVQSPKGLAGWLPLD